MPGAPSNVGAPSSFLLLARFGSRTRRPRCGASGVVEDLVVMSSRKRSLEALGRFRGKGPFGERRGLRGRRGVFFF